MTDPLTLIAMGAAVGGAAGKFVEKAWDVGEKWIASYYENHREKVQEQARKNSADFLNELAPRVKQLEEHQQVSKETIESAQDHPDFSILLQKALLSAAQTDRKDKHQLLARLVAERLKASPESLLSLASKMACDAISYTNLSQLKILGLQAAIIHIKPTSPLPKEQFTQWLVSMFAPFVDLEIKPLDLMHLEGLSCVKTEALIGRDINQFLAGKNNNQFDPAPFFETDVGKKLLTLWKEKTLKSVSLTSIGQIIGVYVFDMVTNSTTAFADWY